MYRLNHEQPEINLAQQHRTVGQEFTDGDKNQIENYSVPSKRISARPAMTPQAGTTAGLAGSLLPNNYSTTSDQSFRHKNNAPLGNTTLAEDKRKSKRVRMYKGVIDLIKGVASASLGGYAPDGIVRLHNNPYLPNVYAPLPIASLMNYFSMRDIDKWEEEKKEKNKFHREKIEAMKNSPTTRPIAKTYENFMDFKEAREAVFPFKSPMHAVAAMDIGLKIDDEYNNLSSASDRFAKKIDRHFATEINGKTYNHSRLRNALRHTIWQGTLASQHNPQIAYAAAMSHETRPYADTDKRVFNNEEEADMITDLLNNVIGRRIGANNPDLSRKEIAILALEELWKNGLYQYEQCNDGTWRIAKVRISNEVFSNMYRDFWNSDNDGRE